MAREYFGFDGTTINDTGSRQFFGFNGATVNEEGDTGAGMTQVSSDRSSSYAVAERVSSDLASSYTISAAGMSSVSSDCASGYAITGRVSSDGASSYAVRQAVSQDLASAYAVRTRVSQDLASSYAVLAPSGSFTTEGWYRNDTQSVWASQAVSWSWIANGRVGDLTGKAIIENVSVTLSAAGVLTATGLPTGPGLLIGAVRGATFMDDQIYFQPGTVT